MICAGISTTFELQPEDTVVVIGSDGLLNCLPPLSLPPAQISWTKNSAQLTGARFQVLQNGSLMISGVQLEDQDVYHCTATNLLLGVSRTSEPARVTTVGKTGVGNRNEKLGIESHNHGGIMHKGWKFFRINFAHI